MHACIALAITQCGALRIRLISWTKFHLASLLARHHNILYVSFNQSDGCQRLGQEATFAIDTADPGVQPQKTEDKSRILAKWSSFWSNSMAGFHPEAGNTREPDSDSDLRGSVAWEGQFPARRGGVVVFALSAARQFTIAIKPMSAAEASGTLT